MLNKRFSWRKKSALTALIAGAFALYAPHLHAATLYWDAVSGIVNGASEGGSGNWGTGTANWDDGVSTVVWPGAGNIASFGGTAGTATLNTAVTADGIIFTVGGYNIVTNTTGSLNLTLGTAGISATNTTGANTISGTGSLTLNGAQTWNVATGGTLNVTSALALGSIANPLTIGGAGGGGITNISGLISGTTATGSVGLTINNGAQVTLSNAANTFTGDIAVDGAASKLVFTGGAPTTTSQLGRGSTTNYKQVLLTNGGTFSLTTADYNDNAPTSTNVAAGQVFNIGTGGGAFEVASGRVFVIDDGSGAGTAFTASQLQGAGNLTKTGLGVLSLGNSTASNAVFTGQILVNQGVLRLGATSAAGVALGSTTANTVIASGAAFDVNNSASTAAEPITISGVGAGASATYNAATGNGTNAIYSSNAAAGSFAGPITLAADSTIGAGAAGTMTLSGGVTGAFNLTLNNLNAGGTAFTTAAVNNTGNITNSGTGVGGSNIASVGGNVVNIVQNSGTSALTLSSATTNAYTGTTTVTQGTLNVGGIAASGSGPLGTSVSNVVLGGATTAGSLIFTNAAPGTFFRNFDINAGGGVIGSTGGTLVLTPTTTGLTGGTATAISLANGPLTLNTGATAATNYITLGSGTMATPVLTGTNALNKTGAGTATLSTITGIAPIQSAIPINVLAGTLNVQTSATGTTASPLGTALITITPGATLNFQSGGHVWNLGNNITVANATGAAIISVSGNLNNTNNINFAAGANTPTVRFGNTSTGAGYLNSYSGTITGTGNVELSATGTTSQGLVTVSGPQNQTGTITNVGNGTATGIATLSGAIGSGITGINQQGTTPFVVNTIVPLSATLNSFNSTGTGLFTFNAGTSSVATQAMTFNANSTGGIAINTVAPSHTGTLVNAGTGTGITNLGIAPAASITNVIQNSPTSIFLISGTQTTYTGNMTVAGAALGAPSPIMEFQTTAALPGVTSNIAVVAGGTFGMNIASGGWSQAEVTNVVNGTTPVNFSAGAYLGLDSGSTNITYAGNLTNVGATSVGLNKYGSSTLTLTGTNTYSGQTIISAGSLIASSTSLSPNSNLNLFGTAVFIPTANFERAEGTGGGQMQISGGTAGFSSQVVGGLTVDFGSGGTPAGVTWGTATFNPTTLVLNDAGSTSTINFSSPINFGAAARTVNIGSSTAATAATLSGQLTGAGGGLTKTGAGILNVTNTTNNYTGATTLSAGTLSFNGGGSTSGTMALPNGTTVSVNAGTLQILNDSTGTLAYGNVVNLGGTQSIIVGNNGGATTGSTIALGQLNAPATATNTGTTTTISSPNNYTTSFTGFALPGAGGATTNLIANSNVIIAGPVTNRMASFGNTNYDTLALQGTATGTITGVISDASGASQTAGGTTPVTKSGTGTWILSGTNTYGGSTSVTGGTLVLQDTTGVGNAGVGTTVLTQSGRRISSDTTGGTLVNGGTLAIQNKVTIGNGTATGSTFQGTVSIGTTSNGTLTLQDSSINTLTILGNNATGATTFLNLGGTAGIGATLNLDLGANATDQIVITPSAISGSGKVVLGAGGAVVNLNQLPSTSLTTGLTYTLMSYSAGGTFTGAFTLGSYSAPGQIYTLNQTGTALTLAVTAGAGTGNVFWRGNLGSTWNTGAGTAATNFTSDYAGTTSVALPDASTNVFFSSTNAAAANFASTTLTAGLAVNSLNIIGAAPTDTNPVGIGGSYPLTIAAAAGFSDQSATAYAAGTGLVMQTGAAATTISAPVILGGNQSWLINSANGLTASGAISGTSSLTKTGTGTLTLGGANTFSGGLTIVNGTVITNNNGAGGLSTSTITLGSSAAGAGAASLLGNSFTVPNNINLAAGAIGTPTIGNNGGATAAVFSGNIALGATDLTVNGSGTGSVTLSGLISGTAALNLNGVSQETITGSNVGFSGPVNISNNTTVNANQATASNAFTTLGTGQINLASGTLSVKSNGTASAQVITTGNGTTGNNLNVTGSATLNVNNNGANVAGAFAFNNLSLNASTLSVTGANNYQAIINGTTTLTGAGTLNPTTASLNLLGKVSTGAFPLTVSGAGATRLQNTATGGGANSIASVNINGGNLVAYAPASGAVSTSSNSLGTGAVTLSGTSPTLNLAPSLAGGLVTPATAGGLFAKAYSSTSLAATNFLGAAQGTGAADFSGNFTYLNNLPAAGGQIANVPAFAAAAGFKTNTAFQFTGLLNITNGGTYNFSTQTDDYGNLFIDGNPPIVSAVTTVTGSVYLAPGLHTISYRAGNIGGNGTIGLQYQGPDQPTMANIPSSVLSNTTSAALATNFGNDIVINAGTSGTIATASNTTLGSLSMSGTGAGTTLTATGSGDLTSITFTGATTLTDSLTINTTTANVTLTGAIGDGGGNFGLTKSGFGTLFVPAASTYGGITTINGGFLNTNSLGNGGVASGIGQSSNAATNLVFSGAGTLQYTGATAVSDRAFTINAGITGSIDVTQANTNLSLAGLTGAVTTGALTKTGLGALTLTGAQTNTGNYTVNNGALNFTGTANMTGLAASTKLNIAPTAGNNAVVNYTSSATSTLNAITGATVAGTASAFNMTAGQINITPGTTTGTQSVVGGNGAYGTYNISGGTLRDTTGTAGGARFTMSDRGTGAINPTTNPTFTNVRTSVVNVSGTGIIDNTNGEWWLNYSLGQINLTDSGKIDRTGSNNPFDIAMDTTVVGGTYGVLNLAGANAQFLTGNTKGIQFGNSTTVGSNDGNSAFYNLAAGTFSTGVNAANNLAATVTAMNYSYYNWAGGTLKSTAALTQWTQTTNTVHTAINTVFGPINNSAVAGAPSFAGGAAFDTTGGTITLPATMTLNGATGVGVTQANLTVTSGAGYIGAPAVVFSKPASASGVPASGYAQMNGGTVVGIVITDPGVYASGETPTISLVGGGATTAASVTSSSLTTANANTGGLTKKGTGTLAITATAHTFGGAVDIQNGILSVTTLSNGGVASSLGQSSNAAGNLLLNSATAGGGILQYITATVPGTTDRNFTLANISGGFDASGGTNGSFTLTAANAMSVAPGLGNAVLTLQGSGLISASSNGSIGTLIGDGTGTSVGVTKAGTGTWVVTNVANSYTGPTTINGGTYSVSKLDVGGATSSIGASTNAAANLVLSGGTLLYTGVGSTSDRNYTFGNATTVAGAGIDTTGATGPLVISGNMTAVNATAGTQVLTLTSLAASGANALNGNIVNSSATALTGITKAGAGAWTLGGANNYSGLTTVNAGTLNITGTNSATAGSAITFGGTANGIVNINSTGTVSAGAINWGGATGGVVNLVGGTLLANGNLTSTSATVNALNFNGGTLKSNAAITISSNLNIAIQAGGGTVDTSGGNITSSSAFANTASPGTLNILGGNTLSTALSATQTGPVNVTGSGTKLLITTTAGATYTNLWTVGTGATVDINNLGNFSFAGLAGGGTIQNTGASAVRTITVTGTGGNNFGGSITQPTPATAGTGVTINLASGTQTFAGVSNYGGPTQITGGTLSLTSTAGLGNTAISVSAGKGLNVFSGAGTVTAGNSATTNLGATLNLAATSNFSMLDGSVGTFSLVQNAATGTVPVTMSGANLSFDINSTGVDQIISNGFTTASVFSGTNVVNLTASGTSLTPGTYPLVTAPGIVAGTTNGFFKFNNGLSTMNLNVGLYNYPLSLNSVAGIEQLVIGTGIISLSWTGQTNGNGAANSVWSDTASGNNFANGAPAATDFVVGGAVTFQDLNTLTNTNVTNSTVNVAAAGVNPSSVTVNNATVNYTIQNASGIVGITGSTGLNKSGTGLLTLSSANTYSGDTNINGGNLSVGDAGALGTGLIAFGGGTLRYGTGITTDFSNRFSTAAGQAISIDTGANNVTFGTVLSSVGGSLTKTGSGTLTLAANETFTGGVTINGGTLQPNANSAALTAGTITVNNSGTLLLTTGDNLGLTAGTNVLAINAGGTVANNTAGTRTTLINTVTMVGGSLSGTSTGDVNRGAYSFNNATAAVIATSDALGNPALINTVGGGSNDGVSLQNTTNIFNVSRGTAVTGLQPDLVISSPIRQYAAIAGVLTKSGNGIMTLSGANTYTGGTVIANGTVLMGPTGTLGAITGGLTMGDTAGNAGALDLQTTSQTVGSLAVATSGATLKTNTITLAAGNSLTVTGTTNVGNTATGSNNTVLSVNGTPTSTLNLTTASIGVTSASGGPGAQNAQLIVTGGTAVNMNLGTGALNIGYRSNNGGTASTVQGTSGTLDLSAAGNVSITGTTNASTILLGNNNTGHAGTAVFDVTTGTIKLSTTGTNTVTAGTLTLGTSVNQGAAAAQGYLVLGNATNNLNIDTIYVGQKKSIINGTTTDLISFAGTGGTLNLKGFAGGTSKAALRIGYNDAGGTGTTTVGNVDLTGGAFNAQLSTLHIGYYLGTAGSVGGSRGTLTMTAGNTTLDALVMANPNASATSTSTTAVLNLSGGSLTFGSTGTGITSGSAGNSGVATINLSGTGLLELANKPITLNGTGSAINMTGGTISNVTTYSVNALTSLTNAGGTLQRTTAGTSTFGAVALTGTLTSPEVLVTAGTMSTTGITSTNANSRVRVEGGTLDLNTNTLAAGSLLYRSGSINNVATGGATLNSATNPLLVLRDTNVNFNVTLAGGPTSSSSGDIQFENTTGGASGGQISGTVDLGGVVRKINVANSLAALSDLTISNSISNGGIEKIGTGTLLLSGTSTYTGTTTVTAGTLVVNGSITSPMTVAAGGTLAGNGFTGDVTFVGGGELKPGNSPDTLHTGSMVLDALSTLTYELDTPNVIGSGVNDLTSVTGNLTLDGTLNVTDLGNFGIGVYTLFTYTGSLTNSGLSLGSLPSGYNYGIDTSTPGQVNLAVSVIPEPSTLVLGGMALLGLAGAGLRRRRLAKQQA